MRPNEVFTPTDDSSGFDLPPTQFQYDYRHIFHHDRQALVESINVRGRVEFAFRDLLKFLPAPGVKVPTALTCQAWQQRFVLTLEIATQGNPYPGSNYSLEKGKALLDQARSVLWTPENIHQQVAALQASFEASLKA